MPGVKGMVHSKTRDNVFRGKVWQSMRVKRRFTMPDLCRTSTEKYEQSCYENIKKWVKKLENHGYVEKTGPRTFRRVGEFQAYRLVRETGPVHPVTCDKCGKSLSAKECKREVKHEE